MSLLISIEKLAPCFGVLAAVMTGYTAANNLVAAQESRSLEDVARKTLLQQALLTLVFMLGIALAMQYTVRLGDGVLFDERNAILGAAVLFLGIPLSFCVVMGGLALRIYQAGPGLYVGIAAMASVWSGCAVICSVWKISPETYLSTRIKTAVACALYVAIISALRIMLALTTFKDGSPPTLASAITISDAVVAVAVVQFLSCLTLVSFVLVQYKRDLFRKNMLDAKERLQRVLEALPDLVAVQDATGENLMSVQGNDLNRQAQSDTTLFAESLNNSDYREVFERSSRLVHIHQTLQDKKVHQEVYRFEKSPGDIKVWDIRTIPLTDTSVISLARNLTEEMKVRIALDERTENLELMLQNTRDMVGFVEIDETLSCLNHAGGTLMGYTPAQLAVLSVARLVEPRHLSRARNNFNSVVGGKQDVALFECGALAKTGEKLWLDVRLSSVKDKAGILMQRALFSVRDATLRKSSESSALIRRQALDNLPLGVVTVNIVKGRIHAVNKGFCRLTGFSAKEAIGARLGELLKSIAPPARSPVDEVPSMAAVIREEFFSCRKDGSWFSEKRQTTRFEDDFSGLTFEVVLLEDLSAEQHDSLTGLPNRKYLLNALKLALQPLPSQPPSFARSNRDSSDALPLLTPAVAVFSLDLSNFREINKSFGRTAGDLVLCAVSKGLSSLLDPSQALSRVESDEFALIVPHLSRDTTEQLATSLLNWFKMPLTVEGETIFIGANIGISICYSNSLSAEELLQQSHLALEDTISQGSGAFGYFDEKTRVVSQRNALLGAGLRSVLSTDSDELYLEYQPKARLVDDKLLGFEALCRWLSPSLGRVSPVEFIPIAETLGLITLLGDRVFETACQQLVKWRDLGLQLAPVAVNLSVHQLYSSGLSDQLTAVLQKCGLSAKYLQLEVTESVLMNDVDRAEAALSLLREKGFKIALDDFGTGYSSMAYLQKLPLDVLKLDRSFVQNLGSNRESESICKSILGLARSLGLATVAEGVETSLQKQFLLDNGCDAMQGYLFAPPLSVQDAQALLLKTSSL